VEYKRVAWAYPLRDFHKICSVYTPFQDALAAKIWLDLLKGVMELWGFNLRVSGYPKISAPPNVLEVQERAQGPLSTCKVWWDSDFTRRRGGQKRWVVRPFVCLSVRHVRDCAPDFAMKALEYRKDFDAVGQGRLVVVHPCSTLWDCCQLATTLNAEIQKTAKIGVFRQQRATQ